jgi:hypothetical protein
MNEPINAQPPATAADWLTPAPGDRHPEGGFEPTPISLQALFCWAHEGCPGVFRFHERLPKATVYACPECGQHRVSQDNEAAHAASMAALADALVTAAGLGEPEAG